MNYKTIFTLCLALFLSITSFAQPDQTGANKIASEKATFIQGKIKLTPEESEKFWPIYNNHNKQMRANRQKTSKAFTKSAMDSTDEELEARFEGLLDSEETSVKLKRAYFNDLKSFLPIRTIAKLYMAEKAFNREVLKQIKERNED